VPRPPCCRRVGGPPRCGRFGPLGGHRAGGEPLVLGVDELEALRLADLGGLYQEEAARRMNVSRQTFGRIIEAARRKVAQALVEGRPLRIEGGPVEVTPMRRFQCDACQHVCEVPQGAARPEACPACQSPNIHRAAEDCGCAGPASPHAAAAGGHGRGRCACHGPAGRSERGARCGGRHGIRAVPETDTPSQDKGDAS
jgi:predicted DNA-binding protein (UPF0251 family)